MEGCLTSPGCKLLTLSWIIERLLKLKNATGETFNGMKLDGLLASEWAKLDDCITPFSLSQSTTNTMQTDNFALSNVIPVLTDNYWKCQTARQALL